MAGGKGGKGSGTGRVAKNWGSKDYRKSKMKERQVEFRYCRKQTAEQNYKRHLQQLHQEEYEKNPGDIRQHGEQTINFFKQLSVRGVEGGDRVQASTYCHWGLLQDPGAKSN